MDEVTKPLNALTYTHNVVNDLAWEGVYFQEFQGFLDFLKLKTCGKMQNGIFSQRWISGKMQSRIFSQRWISGENAEQNFSKIPVFVIYVK